MCKDATSRGKHMAQMKYLQPEYEVVEENAFNAEVFGYSFDFGYSYMLKQFLIVRRIIDE